MQKLRLVSRFKMKVFAWASLCALSCASSQSFAVLVSVTNDNSSVGVETNTGGIQSWSVDGFGDQVFEQQYYYRIGNSGSESLLGTLTLDSSATGGIDNNQIQLQYSGNGVSIEMNYFLVGGANGTGVADIAKTIEVTNTSGSTLDFHLFQYNDYDLFGSSVGDTATWENANTIRQVSGNSVFQETVTTPAPDHFEIGPYASIRNSLADGSTTTLSDGFLTYSGDATWAWQWDLTLAADDAVIISKDLGLDIAPIPVPAAVWLFGSGLLGMVGIARRKKAA